MGKHLVLLLDDDQAVRESLQFALELEGLCVHVHNRGDGLLADPDLARAGCVVVDGFAVLQLLKERNIRIPSILLSSHVTDRIRDRARAAGVSQVLEKPLMDNALRDSIRAIVNLRSFP